MRVSVLIGPDQVQAIDPTLRAFMIEHDRDVVTRESSAEINGRRVVTSIASERRRGDGDVKRLIAFTLHPIMFETRAFLEHALGDRSEEHTSNSSHVALS